MKKTRALIKFVAIVTASLAATGSFAAETTLIWHGQAAFEIRTPKGHVLFVDPWLNNPLNPKSADKHDAVASIEKADYILLTHGHFDHVGDTVALAKKTKARLVAGFELGTNLVRMLDFPKDQMGADTLINPGGEIVIADGEVKVAMTPAIHSSGMDYGKQDQPVMYGGAPGGYVIAVKNGPVIYHTGDTAYFRDMELIREQYHPDVGLINIGGHFGMGPDMAAKAARATQVKLAIPMHFKTFPLLTQTPSEFFKLLDEKRPEAIAHLEMTPGVPIVFEGNHLKK